MVLKREVVLAMKSNSKTDAEFVLPACTESCLCGSPSPNAVVPGRTAARCYRGTGVPLPWQRSGTLFLICLFPIEAFRKVWYFDHLYYIYVLLESLVITCLRGDFKLRSE